MTNSAHSERSMSIALADFGSPHSVFPWEEPHDKPRPPFSKGRRAE